MLSQSLMWPSGWKPDPCILGMIRFLESGLSTEISRDFSMVSRKASSVRSRARSILFGNGDRRRRDTDDGSAHAFRPDDGQVCEASQKALLCAFPKSRSAPGLGAETPIELFLIQALAKEKLFPQRQMLIMGDGATFPSLYHLWQDLEVRHSDGLVAEVDLYFPTERVAVFCDGSHHARNKQKAKDAAINGKLEALGIKPVRIPGSEIKFDLAKAVSRVKEALVGSETVSTAAGDSIEAE